MVSDSAPGTSKPTDQEDVARPLAHLKHAGLQGALKMYESGAIFAAVQAVQLAFTFARKPASFFHIKDRSAMDVMKQPVPGAVHEWIEANGIRFHAVSMGRKPHKPLMLFLHGFPEFWMSWRHQLAHYAQDYDAVAIDMRGFGSTDKPPGVANYRLDVLVADVVAVVKALGHTQCVLVSHDWGGVVAWMVAAMHPEVVKQLVTLAAPHLGLWSINGSAEQQRKGYYVMMFQYPWVPEWTMLNNDLAALEDTFRTGSRMGPKTACFSAEEMEWYKWAFSQPGTATASINYYRALVAHLTYAPIPEVWQAMRRRMHMPVLSVMAGADGALEPSLLNQVEAVAPNCEFHVLPGVSHWVPCEQPVKVNELIDSFLKRHGDTAAASML